MNFLNLFFVKRLRWHHILLLVCLIYVTLVQHLPSWGAFYADTLYLYIARPLFWLSSWFPLAVGDLFIAASLLGVVTYPFYAYYVLHRKKWTILWNIVVYLLWVYVWFYLVWGLNYYQPNIYQRTSLEPVEYCDSTLYHFAERYVAALNTSYVKDQYIDKDEVAQLIQQGYEKLDENMGVHKPFHPQMCPKTMVFSHLASKVGVLGSMAPFFCEFTLNAELLPNKYPFSVAHEMSHVLGVTSEAEANFYAYLVCISSTHKVIKYSGYYELLSYVCRDVRVALGEKAYEQLLSEIRPEILQEKAFEREYWRSKYSPVIGGIQNIIYDAYLKQHRVEGGLKNYSYVIGLLLSYDASIRKTGPR